jgi:hypothetical protein
MLRKAQPKISHRVLARTLALFQQGTVTAKQLHLEVGVHLVTAQAWLRTLMDEGTIHVCDWLPDSLGRDAVPVYKLGAGEKAPRRRKTRAQIMREYRQRQKELK